MSISGEKNLLTIGNGVLTLTNYRVIFDSASRGASRYAVVPLDAVDSCGLTTHSQPILLLLACVAAILFFLASTAMLFGFSLPLDTVRYGFLVTALLSGAAYLITSRVAITISSSGGEQIVLPLKSIKHEEARAFLDAVLEARLA